MLTKGAIVVSVAHLCDKFSNSNSSQFYNMKKIIPILLFIFLLACTGEQSNMGDLLEEPYHPIPVKIATDLPFPKMVIPTDNPFTEQGIALGRRLFYDPILSVDSTISCSSCHHLANSFTDKRSVSLGVNQTPGNRSSMSLLNIGYHLSGLFWDGRSSTLERQALIPVEDPLEMKEVWPQVVKKLKEHRAYPALFRQAFGISDRDSIQKELVVKAIAQFERTLISSGTSKYDRVKKGLATYTPNEAMGEDLFFDITADVKDAECGNCHNAPFFTTFEYANNGLDDVSDVTNFKDKGRGKVTGDIYDNGKFRIPGIRNIALTAPYMHDGRFETLEEVLEHYDTGGHPSPTVHPLIRPLNLTALEKQQIIAFLHTLTDTVFVQNDAYSNPF